MTSPEAFALATLAASIAHMERRMHALENNGRQIDHALDGRIHDARGRLEDADNATLSAALDYVKSLPPSDVALLDPARPLAVLEDEQTRRAFTGEG